MLIAVKLGLILKKYVKNIIVYDKNKECLGVPLTVPFPRILARAAALCSGKAPLIHRISCKKIKMPNGPLFYLYTEVPEVVADTIAQKAGQKIIKCAIDMKKVG